MTDIEGGTWDFMRQRQLWHFDPNRTEARTAHSVIAQVRGDLDRLASEIPLGEAKTLGTSMAHRDGTASFFDQIQAGNEADARRLGLDPTMQYAMVFDSKRHATDAPLAHRLVSQLPLEDAYWKLHRQRPGQVWPVHFDNYHAFARGTQGGDEWADPGVRRLWIMLSDWRWGQFVQVGNWVWSHWAAGDVLYFDWLIPHGSANCGHEDRLSMLVTGRTTDELSRWVDEGQPRVIDIS